MTEASVLEKRVMVSKEAFWWNASCEHSLLIRKDELHFTEMIWSSGGMINHYCIVESTAACQYLDIHIQWMKVVKILAGKWLCTFIFGSADKFTVQKDGYFINMCVALHAVLVTLASYALRVLHHNHCCHASATMLRQCQPSSLCNSIGTLMHARTIFS